MGRKGATHEWKGAALLIGVIAALLAMTPISARLEGPVVDLLFRLRGPRATQAKVVILEIDQRTEQSWSEPSAFWGARFAGLIETALESGARGVGIDAILMGDPDPMLVQSLGPSAPQPNLRLEEALYRAGNRVVLARGARAIPNPALVAASDGKLGLIDLPPSPDGVVRAVWRAKGRPPVPGFAAALAGEKPVTESLLLVNYTGREFPTMSALDLETAGAREKLKDAYVIIGATYPGSGDVHDTPFGAGLPGAQVHANALATLLDGRPLRTFPLWLSAVLAFVAATGGWFFATNARHQAAMRAIAGMLCVYFLVGYASFIRYDLSLPVAIPVLSILMGSMAGFTTRGLADASARRRIEVEFGAHVSEEVRDFVLSHSELEKSGGFISDATVMFLDVRGFTTRAESARPEELMADLNVFFEATASAVRRNEGLVLHFLGDGFVAVFGAPIPSINHAAAGVRAAQEIQRSVRILNASLKPEGQWHLGIGIHSGPVQCGFIGTGERRQFTIMGDTVNTAARIQEATKTAGTSVLVSEVTINKIGDARAPREPLTLQLRGRSQAIHAYDLADVEPAGEASPA